MDANDQPLLAVTLDSQCIRVREAEEAAEKFFTHVISEERSDEESLSFSALLRREILRFACLPAGSE
jgi:hypothetical protein